MLGYESGLCLDLSSSTLMFLQITLLHVPVDNPAILAESPLINRKLGEFRIGQGCGRASQQASITLRSQFCSLLSRFHTSETDLIWIVMNEFS